MPPLPPARPGGGYAYLVTAQFVLSTAARRMLIDINTAEGKRLLQMTSAAALGFNVDNFTASLADLTGMPLDLISMQTGPTYRSSSSSHAFRVDSRLLLPLVQLISLPDAHALVLQLSNLSREQLLQLVGPNMAAHGLRIISVTVSGPDVILLSAPEPPPLPPPSWPSASPLTINSGPHSQVTAGDDNLPRRNVALISSFIVAMVLPLVMTFGLYRRRKTFEWQQAQAQRHMARTHLQVRRCSSQAQDQGASDLLAMGALAHKGAWFDASAACLQARTGTQPGECETACGATSEQYMAHSHLGLRRCRPKAQQQGASNVLANCALVHQGSWSNDTDTACHSVPQTEDASASGATSVSTPARNSARTHLQLRRCQPHARLPTARDVFANAELAHKGAWFNASAACLQARACPQNGEYEGTSPREIAHVANDCSEVGTSPPHGVYAEPALPVGGINASATVPPINARVPRAHIEIRRRRRPVLRGAADPIARGALQHKGAWFNVSEANLRQANQHTLDGSSNSVASSTDARESQGSAHNPDMDGQSSLPSYGLTTANGQAAAASEAGARDVYGTQLPPMIANATTNTMTESTSMFQLPLSLAEQLSSRAQGHARDEDLDEALQTPTGGGVLTNEEEASPETILAAARSEAVLSRARARARAKGSATKEAAPEVTVNTQQEWLAAAMGAASEQDYAPVDVQHDWLMQAIEQIDEDDGAPSAALVPGTPFATPTNSPRTSLGSPFGFRTVALPSCSTSRRNSRASTPAPATEPSSGRSPCWLSLPSAASMLSPSRAPAPAAPSNASTPSARERAAEESAWTPPLNFTIGPDDVDPDSGVNPNHLYV